jgi:hypothetical protein
VNPLFSKVSRYRKVPILTAPDARGRVLAVTDIRQLPEVPGTFLHTVDSGDRLDQLATTYYDQPLQYWRICDANPDTLSPLALIDDEPVRIVRFPVASGAEPPPWSAALVKLSSLVGVEDVRVGEDVRLVSQTQTIGDKEVPVTVERFDRALIVTFNAVSLDASAVAKEIAKTGFTVGPPEDLGGLGQPIVIPPAVTG